MRSELRAKASHACELRSHGVGAGCRIDQYFSYEVTVQVMVAVPVAAPSVAVSVTV